MLTLKHVPHQSSLELLQTKWDKFYIDFLKGTPIWEKQVEIWDSIVAHQRTLVVSGHATGKDYISGRIIPWFLITRKPSIVLTTAPSDRQVRVVIWGEVRSAVHGSPYDLGGRLLEQEWKIADKHYAIGFTTKDYASVSQKFQGFHSDNVLLVMSEAAGIHPSIWDSMEGVTTGDHVRLLAISQPIGEYGPFYEALRNGCTKGNSCTCNNWHVINVSSWEAAAAREKYGIKGLASREWCEDRLKKWGEDSPLYQSRVLGQVPKTSADQIIALEWALTACDLELSDQGLGGIGVDVARSLEGDSSVISAVKGQCHVKQKVLNTNDATVLVGETLLIARELGFKTIAVDETGVGGPVVDLLRESSRKEGLSIIGVNFGGTPGNKTDFANKATEMWWDLREDLRLGKQSLVKDDDLTHELTSRKFDKHSPNSKGQMVIESKLVMKNRGLHSPDRVDALLLAREAQAKAGSGGTGMRVLDVETVDSARWVPVR